MKQNRTELDWVKKISAGDVSAFENLFNLYSEPLLDFALTYVKLPQVAEDIVQGVFVNIWMNRKKLKPSLTIRSYLYKAVRNQALKHLRHVKVKRRSEDNIIILAGSIKTPDDELIEKEFIASVHRAIEELPEKCRLIFTMNRYDGLTYSEIAEIQDISVNTVKTQMSRAFKFLRKRLANFFLSSL